MSGYSVFGDWGTTRLRLFRVADGRVTDRATGPGIGAPGIDPEATLRAALADWRVAGRPDSIRLCGMVGARSGWREVAYAECPADRAAWLAAAASLTLDDTPVTIMAGLASVDRAGVPDVMRGEETQVFGALACDATLGVGDRILVLPGTHSKWVRLRAGRITDFRTVPTGELFALLRDHSTLTGGARAEAHDDEGFGEGLATAATGSGPISALFAARAQQLRGGRDAGWALDYLSGLLIGAEIVEMRASLAVEQPDALIGDPNLTDLYARAFGHFGLAVRRLDGDNCALAGLGMEERQ